MRSPEGDHRTVQTGEGESELTDQARRARAMASSTAMSASSCGRRDVINAAARGAAGSAVPWRDERAGPKANTASAKLGAVTRPGSFPLGDSPEAISDLLGNVWEWTSTAMTAYPGAASLPDSLGRYRVIRGGAFDTPDSIATTWFRGFNRPDAPPRELSTTGFRCAVSEPRER